MRTITLPEPQQNYPDQDCCPECATDWKRACPDYCSQYVQCEFPPGCTEGTKFGRRVCQEHYAALSAFFAPA
jgi:hypothetical protein